MQLCWYMRQHLRCVPVHKTEPKIENYLTQEMHSMNNSA